MTLPSTQRREINAASRKKIWLYGAPFSGKTTLADSFPVPLMLNTDGNTNSFTAPFISIKETLEGRLRVSAWENFKETINDLQKGSDFKTVVVDLVEDLYEHCRSYVFAKENIEHESDAGYGKGYDKVRKEFLDTMKKLLTLDYNMVLISHEYLGKDVTRKSGDKITAICPNINDKVANKLAGMVDVVCRVVADGDERTLQFKSQDYVFGGGRLKIHETIIPLTYEALEKVYASQEAKKVVEPTKQQPSGSNNDGERVNEQPNLEKQTQVESEQPVVEEQPTTEQPVEEQPVEQPVTEEQPVRRRRRRTKAEMEAARAEQEQQPEPTPEPDAPWEEKKELTIDDVIEVAKPICEKYGQDEFRQILASQFNVRVFKELKPEQYEAAIKALREYQAQKESDETLF